MQDKSKFLLQTPSNTNSDWVGREHECHATGEDQELQPNPFVLAGRALDTANRGAVGAFSGKPRQARDEYGQRMRCGWSPKHTLVPREGWRICKSHPVSKIEFNKRHSSEDWKGRVKPSTLVRKGSYISATATKANYCTAVHEQICKTSSPLCRINPQISTTKPLKRELKYGTQS